MTEPYSEAWFASCEQIIQDKIDAFADHDWGEHDPAPHILWHALSVASGIAALESLRKG